MSVIIRVAYVNTILIQHIFPLTYFLSLSIHPHIKLWVVEGEGKIIGEDSWIIGLSFVTLCIHPFAIEKRRSRHISKEQLTLPIQS